MGDRSNRRESSANPPAVGSQLHPAVVGHSPVPLCAEIVRPERATLGPVRWLSTLAIVACSGPPRAPVAADDPLAARFPLAGLDDRALCDRLLARTPADYAIAVDPEPAVRRKVIVSDLHLGPGTADPKYAGIEDFYSDAAWTAFLKTQTAAGPTDLIIAGDFIEFWQIASIDGALPRRDDRLQPDGPV